MLREPRRLIASIIAIAAGVAFVAATLVLSASLERSITRDLAGPSVGSAVVVEPTLTDTGPPTLISDAVVAEIKRVQGVTRVRPQLFAFFTMKLGSGEQFLQGFITPELSDATTLVAGRTPTASGEVAVSEFVATNRKVAVGQSLSLKSPMAEAVTEITVTVVGVIRPGPEVAPGTVPLVFASAADLARWRGEAGYDTVYVDATRDASLVRDDIRRGTAVKAANLTVTTTADHIAQQRKAMSELVRTITGFLLAFGVVALLVSTLVIANTFSILVAQRTRQLALLRCVGATRGQVFRTVLGEALLMGVVGGAIGVGLGVGLSFGLFLLAKVFDFGLRDFAVSWLAVVAPLAMGVAVTLVASVLPAVRATRVMPLAALRPHLAPVTATRTGRVLLAVGALLVAGGTAALLYGAMKPGMQDAGDTTYLVVGIAGGVASFIGVMFLGTLIIPALARVVGAIPAKVGGVPGRLAADNSRRNPARAAATASALLIGVTLITMTTVGAQSGQATAQDAFDRLFPADLIVTPRSGQVSAGMVTTVKANAAVVRTERVNVGVVTVAGKERPVYGASLTLRDLLRNPGMVAGLAEDTIVMPTDAGVAAGSSVTVTGPKGSRTLRALVPKNGPSAPTVTMTTLGALTGEIRTTLWVRLTDKAVPSQVSEALAQSLSSDPVTIEGGALMREQIDQILAIVVGVITALLAVSVLIALVGITNTLGLSVLERTQESGLLRAMGLTAGGLRSMFALEALVLAAVAVVLGVGLGFAYGVAGVYALLKGTGTIIISVPWWPILAIAVVAMLAGLVASVVPAIRAGRIQPAAALASGE